MQTHQIEKLLQLETELLEQFKSVKPTAKGRLEIIREQIDAEESNFSFVRRKGQRIILTLPQCADPAHNPHNTVPCFVVVSLATQSDDEDIAGALKWCIGGMIEFREHLSFLSEEITLSGVSLRYRSKSQTAAVCLKAHLNQDKVFGKIATVSIENFMFVSAAPFVAQPTQPVQETKKKSEDDVRKEQISQLFQYYNGLMAREETKQQMPRLGNPNHFNKEPISGLVGTSIQMEDRADMRNFNPEIKKRYTVRQLLSIFKSCGRFQSPVQNLEAYKLSSEEDLVHFMLQKPSVVLEHMKTSQALPLHLGEGKDIRGRLLENMTQQLTKLY